MLYFGDNVTAATAKSLQSCHVPHSLQRCGLWHIRLLCPWNSPGRNSGVGWSAFLQLASLTSPAWQVGSLPLVPWRGEGSGNPLQYSCLENPMEEPGRLQSMGSLGLGRDWVTSLSLFPFMHWRRKWHPTPVFLPGVSQGQQSLVGCRLWGRTESDTTEAT